MRLFEKVMLWLVPRRHSSGVAPVKRGPDADRFSSVAQVRLQWSMMTLYAPMVEMPSSSHPLIQVCSAEPGRIRIC